jgi:hypothetical protein
MDGDTFKLLRNAADSGSFEQYGNCQLATRIEADRRAYHALDGHKTFGIPFLDLYGAGETLVAAALGEQDAGNGQKGTNGDRA